MKKLYKKVVTKRQFNSHREERHKQRYPCRNMILFNLTFNENVRKKKKLIDQHLQNLFNTFKILLIIVNGWKPLTIITKRSILDVAAALDLPLDKLYKIFNRNTLKVSYSCTQIMLSIMKFRNRKVNNQGAARHVTAK